MSLIAIIITLVAPNPSFIFVPSEFLLPSVLLQPDICLFYILCTPILIYHTQIFKNHKLLHFEIFSCLWYPYFVGDFFSVLSKACINLSYSSSRLSVSLSFGTLSLSCLSRSLCSDSGNSFITKCLWCLFCVILFYFNIRCMDWDAVFQTQIRSHLIIISFIY